MSPDSETYAHPSSRWWLILPLLQALTILVLARPAGIEWAIYASQICITAFSSWRLFSDRTSYSLNQVWWIFSIIFLSAMPSAQVAAHTTPWHTGDILPSTMLRANCLVLAGLGLFEGVRLWASRHFFPYPSAEAKAPTPVLARQFEVVAPIIMLACGTALIIVLKPAGLFLRGHLEQQLWKHNTTFQLVFDKGLRGTMLWCCLTAIVLFLQRRLSRSSLWLILILGILFNFPMAMPRYLTLTFYLSAALAAGLPFFRKAHRLSVTLLAIMLLVAPLSSVTRYGGMDMMDRMKRPAEVFQSAVILTDYDAWSSLCRVMQYTGEQGTTHGRQLMGVALFFVPRSVWPDKPIGSGAFLFNQLDLGFNNVACTFLAEGYINFGVVGSLVFAVLMALVIARYDSWFWRRSSHQRFSLSRLFYFVAIGMLFYMLRGDLMSSFAYTAGFAAMFVFWQAVFFWRLPRRKGAQAAASQQK